MRPACPVRVRYDVAGTDVSSLEIEAWPDRTPIRLRNHGRRRRANGVYSSVKNGRSLPWESYNELRAFHWAEVSYEVIRYYAQPHTLHVCDAAGSWHYTPDRADLLAGNRRRYVEVKPDPAGADERARIERVAQIYRLLGHAFRVERGDDLAREPSYSAVRQIEAFRRTVVTSGHLQRVARLLAEGPRPLGEIQSALGTPSWPPLAALVVRRVIQIDIRGGLRADSWVELTPAFLGRDGRQR